MPRESKRAEAIRKTTKLLRRRLIQRFLRELYDSDSELYEDDDLLDSAVMWRYQCLLHSRYCSPRQYRPRETRFWWYLHSCSDREFLRCFRMARSSFHKLVELISTNSVFANTPGKRSMASPDQQLLVFLEYVGTLGSDSCMEHLGTMFAVSSGACFNYVTRVASSLVSLYKSVVVWPDAIERTQIAARIRSGYDFPNCIGLIDGTLLPLAFRPTTNGEDYFTRKGGYALSSLICCDDRARITYALIGWPGSTHDNRVWVNSAVFLSSFEHFAPSEYLIGDSAFRPSRHMIPSFKKLPGGVLSREAEYFNTKLSKIRIRSEHSIGLLKARFQYFKGVRVLIKTRADLRRIITFFKAVLVVHNLLIADPVPPELQHEVEAECESEARLRTEMTRQTDVASDEGSGTERRDQLLHYMVELDGRF